MIELIASLIVLLFCFAFLYVFSKHYETVLAAHVQSLEVVSKRAEETNGKFYDVVKEMQIEHFATLEKTSAKQLAQMDKQQKELLKFFKEETVVNQVVPPAEAENDIDKNEDPEIAITEAMKIPIVDGMKVKFEDEEDISSVSIS